MKNEPNIIPQFDVFLSHSSVDKPWVIRLKDDLLRYGVSVWLDKDEIRPGDLFGKALEQALDHCRAVALIVSPEAISSSWVEEEYYRALSLAKTKQTPVQIIPVILREAELPGFLQDRNWVDFRDEAAYAQSVWRLVWGITDKKPAKILDLSATDLPPVAPIQSGRQTRVAKTPDPKALLQCLETRFLMPDLKKICFILGVDWDNLRGDNKTEKIISLIEFFKTRERVPDLVAMMQEVHPGLEC